jgi:5-methylcytosine-specific restriction endonuclease McrA/predicted RNA-binding Zn-ribbon protein involved in translation (DUF1610 family)
MSDKQLAVRRANQVKVVAAIRGVVRVPKVTYRCIGCGAERVARPSEMRYFDGREYRCRACGAKASRLKQIGKHLTQEAKDKISAYNTGKEYSDSYKIRQMESHGTEIWYGSVQYNYAEPKTVKMDDPGWGLFYLFGKFDIREKVRQDAREKRGPLNPCWKGGISTLNHAIRDCAKGLEWRQRVFERDNYTCRVTGYRGKGLHAHHIVPLSKLIKKYGIKTLEEAYEIPAFWDISNGITLHGELHKSKHKSKRKEKETWQIKLVCSVSKYV